MFTACAYVQPPPQLGFGVSPARCEAYARSTSPEHELPPRGSYECGADEVLEGDSDLETLASRDARAREAAAALLNVSYIEAKKPRAGRPSQAVDADALGQQKSRYGSCSMHHVLDMCDQHEADPELEGPLVRQDNSDDEKQHRRCMR
uniref:Uncharacterized protein n=1 Tax=Alexandrium catenella TaxID=2925 RepID=A0A7S1RZ77_ALECA|mmetsp:Transcript_78727/g.209054  ORF Transcript_78727/g.209054 Transcript_78727/m.209054 type:complete len:148 (+) Transcript_78727:78-521(+)